MENLNISVDIQLPQIFSNFENVKTQLLDSLKKYDLVVDIDSVKTAKSMATDLNKLSKQINDLRISKVKEMSAPIREFETKAKELSTLCQDSRQKLLSQVKVFEDEQRELCYKRLNDELLSQYDKYQIKEEFRNIKIDDLAIISNLTKTGLAKKATDTIESRIFEAKAFQDKIEKRLLSLGSVCLENGLMTALTQENINHFLREVDDEIYNNKLLSLIKNEIDRQERYKLMIEEKAKKEAEAKAKAEFEAQQQIVTKVKPALVQPPVQQQNCNLSIREIQKQANQGIQNNISNNIKRYTVTATFEIEVDERLESKLEAMLLKKFEQACFKTMPSIKVVRNG